MIRAAPGARKRIRNSSGRRPSFPDRRGRNTGHYFRRTSAVPPGASSMTETPLIAVCLAGQAASGNGTTTFTVDSRPNQPRDYVTRRVDSTRQEAEGTAVRADASTFPPDPGAGLAAHPDRDPGWSPWPTPNHQTRMIASTAPRATSRVRSPTSLGHGWPSSPPSQRLPSRTAPTVLTSSTPASSRPSANCTKPWPATPDDLAGLPADMESSSVAVGESEPVNVSETPRRVVY